MTARQAYDALLAHSRASADIIAALKKKGTSVSALSRENGLASSTLGNALRFPWPKGEQIIAGAIGVDASEIWPSRYNHMPKAS